MSYRWSAIGPILAALVLIAGPRSARAESHEESDAAQETAETVRMTLPAGRIMVQGFLEINLSSGAAFKPVSLTPDAWYGVDDKLSVGLLHSAYASTGFYGGAGSSLCLTGGDSGCDGFYDNVGTGARYQLLHLPVALAAEGGLFVTSFSEPFQLALKAGAVGRWRSDKISVVFSPNLFLFLAGRGGFNTQILNLPVAGMYELSPQLSVAVQTGIVAPFSSFGDFFQVPFSVGAKYAVDERIFVEGAFSLSALLGGDGGATGDLPGLPTGFDLRVLTVGGGIFL